MINSNGIKLWDIKWSVTTAGPSPNNNERIELFLLGCKKAKNGNPCKGCFNSKTWDDSIAERTYDPVEMAAHINANAPSKYITIGGGEPTDQIEDLIILCRELKKYGFHIMVYTWRSLIEIVNPTIVYEMGTSDSRSFVFEDKVKELFSHIDMLVDGQFILEERLYQEDKEDGLLNSIGSGNQIIWDLKDNNNLHIGYKLQDLDALALKPMTNDLIYVIKEGANELEISL